MARSVATDFRTHLRAALDTAMKTSQQMTKPVTTIRDYIYANGNENALDVMLDIYYSDAEKLEDQGGKSASYISQGIFEQLARLRIEIAQFFDPWLQQALKILQVPLPPAESDDQFRQRYDGLNSVDAGKVRSYLEKRRKEKKNSLLFFEILMDIYWEKHGVLPADDAALLAFAPKPDAQLRKELDTMAGTVLVKATSEDIDGMQTALGEFITWAYSPRDMHRSFQILLWSREYAWRFHGKREDMTAWVFFEIYMISIQRAVVSALNAGYLAVQLNHLLDYEIDVLMQPLEATRYFSDYADRLYAFHGNGAFAAGKHFTDLASLHLILLIYAESRGMYLLSAKERDDIADKILSDEPGLKTKTVWLSGQLAITAHSARVGSRIGDDATLVYLHGSDDLVIAFDDIEHFLFQVSKAKAGNWLDDAFIATLRANTEPLLVLIPAFFQVLQYTATFITGGFLALLSEVVEDQIAEYVAERVTEHTGNENAGMLVAMAGGTILPNSKPMAKGAAGIGTRAVRKATAKWKSQKAKIRKASALKKNSGKGTPKRKPKTRPARSKQPKKRTRAEEKRLIEADNQLRALKKKNNVKLGKKKPNGEYEPLTGYDAIRLLFTGKISEIPRLMQHWPIHRQTKYLNEIRAAIEKGLKNVNPKVKTKIMASVNRGILKQDVLDLMPKALQEEVKRLVSKNWDGMRTAFWRSVRADKALVDELASIGIKFKGGKGSAPDLHLGGITMKCSLDHIARKVENPLEAFSAENIRILTGRDNSVLKEGMVRNIRDTTGLNLDDYVANTNFGKDPIPKDFSEGLAKLIDDSPVEGDIWRSFTDPDPPKTW